MGIAGEYKSSDKVTDVPDAIGYGTSVSAIETTSYSDVPWTREYDAVRVVHEESQETEILSITLTKKQSDCEKNSVQDKQTRSTMKPAILFI